MLSKLTYGIGEIRREGFALECVKNRLEIAGNVREGGRVYKSCQRATPGGDDGFTVQSDRAGWRRDCCAARGLLNQGVKVALPRPARLSAVFGVVKEVAVARGSAP